MSALPLPGEAVHPAQNTGRYRWRVCAMLLAATTINFIDRQALGALAPLLQAEIGWSEVDYSAIVSAFQAAYAIGLLCTGALIDRLGTRLGYALIISLWSLAAMGHALVASVAGFMIVRFLLGLGEAGNFPAAIKTVAEWFPRRERALATGIVNSGVSIGAILAPLCVPLIAAAWGWQVAFLCTGMLGAVWLLIWLYWYRTPDLQPALSAAELRHIRSDPAEVSGKVSWTHILRHRQAWAFVLAKFVTDPVWWFFLFWLPKFLHAQYGLSLLELGLPMVVIFVMADIGSIGGGWLAGCLLRRGWSLNAARKIAMLVCALCVTPIVFAAQAGNVWLAVLLIGLATAGHQGWSANLFTLTSDLFPRPAIGSLVGLGGFAGCISGMISAAMIGWLLQTTGHYLPVFLMAGIAYLLALGLIHWLAPRLQPALLPVPASTDSSRH